MWLYTSLTFLFFCFLQLNLSIGEISDIYLQNKNAIPLNVFPMIMAHDAASGEIVPERDHIVSDWTKTQSSGLIDQLNCGARSFDYRPILKDSTLYAHHGGIVIYVPMESSLQDIIGWSEAHPSDLIILYISHYEGDGCQEEAVKLLQKYSVYTVQDCNQLKNLTYGDALNLSMLVNGGHLLALFDCTNEFYDDSINCYNAKYTCYDSWPKGTSSIPFDNLSTYLLTTTKSNPTVSSPDTWMAQAHWQSTAGSVTLGTLHNSSIVQDERRSGINTWINKQVLNQAFIYLNYLELDEVCDQGNEISQSIENIYLNH